ncbi:hypothetical protein SDC9_135747 [bioreactor metagenome]|uniref:Uncharacterized protein n=1 Tax=bioreactor metagenome TaxID=1076179 RepID=A0A645DIK6_9ZZZZ
MPAFAIPGTRRDRRCRIFAGTVGKEAPAPDIVDAVVIFAVGFQIFADGIRTQRRRLEIGRVQQRPLGRILAQHGKAQAAAAVARNDRVVQRIAGLEPRSETARGDGGHIIVSGRRHGGNGAIHRHRRSIGGCANGEVDALAPDGTAVLLQIEFAIMPSRRGSAQRHHRQVEPLPGHGGHRHIRQRPSVNRNLERTGKVADARRNPRRQAEGLAGIELVEVLPVADHGPQTAAAGTFAIQLHHRQLLRNRRQRRKAFVHSFQKPRIDPDGQMIAAAPERGISARGQIAPFNPGTARNHLIRRLEFAAAAQSHAIDPDFVVHRNLAQLQQQAVTGKSFRQIEIAMVENLAPERKFARLFVQTDPDAHRYAGRFGRI